MRDIGILMGVVAWVMVLAVIVVAIMFIPDNDHTHEPTGVQIGSTICLEFGTLHYPHPMDGSDTHIDAAFCGEVVEVEEEGPRFPPLGTDTHLAQ